MVNHQFRAGVDSGRHPPFRHLVCGPRGGVEDAAEEGSEVAALAETCAVASISEHFQRLQRKGEDGLGC